jgi:hypothetical protein
MTFKIKLKPTYDSKKSFYNKAEVREENGKKILRSYTTDVAEIKDGRAYVYGLYSPTTTRHIKEFLLQNGFEAENSKQIMKSYGGEGGGAKIGGTMKVDNSTTPHISAYGSDGKEFAIDDKTRIVATSDNTRNGFRHTAVLFVDGKEVDKSVAHYQNRIWESYEYQSVVDDLINKSSYVPKEKKDALKNTFAGKTREEMNSNFNSIGAVASLGDVFAKTEKEKNDWKLRMVKAGLGKGFSEPSNWNTLSEKEKGKRLDTVIKHLNKK